MRDVARGPLVRRAVSMASRFATWACATVIVVRAASAAPPEQSVVLKRASESINRYCSSLTNIVAEEKYNQKVVTTSGSTITRTLISDFLFVWVPKDASWVEFRDVYEVDGKPVRDREHRLEALFLKPDGERSALTRKIRDESARYNIGDLSRTLNVPTLILRALMPAHLGRFRFTQDGEEQLNGVKTVVLRFEEVSGPTIVRDPAENKELFSSGKFWIEPETGQVVKSEMVVVIGFRGMFMRARISVEYEPVEEIGIWAPAVMEESYNQSGNTTRFRSITGRAEYSNFRKFSVEVTQEVGG